MDTIPSLLEDRKSHNGMTLSRNMYLEVTGPIMTWFSFLSRELKLSFTVFPVINSISILQLSDEINMEAKTPALLAFESMRSSVFVLEVLIWSSRAGSLYPFFIRSFIV